MTIAELDEKVFQLEEDDSFDDYSEQFVETYASDIYRDFNKLAEKFIFVFFHEKKMYCGGPIPWKILCSSSYITLVLNTNIIDGIKSAHRILQAYGRIGNEFAKNDIECVQNILYLCALSGVPKQFSGGLLLMYLELVEGISEI
jgi:hypothetical protein